MNGNGHNKLTPLAYALSQATSKKVITENKDVVRDFLKSEPSIYQLAFQLAISLAPLKSTADTTFDVFCVFLRARMVVNASEDQIRLLGVPILNAYTSLAKRSRYWHPNKEQQVDGILPFDSLVETWREAEELADNDPLFSQFQEALAS